MYQLLLVALSLGYQAAGTEAEPNDAKDVIVTESHLFKLPVAIDPDGLKQLSEVRLFVSRDGGQTWTHEDKLSVGPERMYFLYRARGPGLYSFSVQTVSSDGRLNPEDVVKEPPNLKVRVIDPIKKAQEKVSPAPKSPDENIQALRQEMRRLRADMERLERRLAEVETAKRVPAGK
jgi:hypothetical protein